MNLNWSHIALYVSSIAVIAIWVSSIFITQNRKVEKIHYSIESVEGARNLITTKEVRKKVDDKYDLDSDHLRIANLDLAQLEAYISEDNRIYATNTFLDAKRELHIEVIQRRPVVRIIDATGEQYYLDQKGTYISKQEFKAVRVPVATGEIEAYTDDWKNKKGRINDCYKIIKGLRKDPFFTALIEQIDFENERIKMIPKIGSAVIIIDDLTDLDQKLNNLKLFYETELAHKNAWEKYDEIEISVKNQVIPRTTNP